MNESSLFDHMGAKLTVFVISAQTVILLTANYAAMWVGSRHTRACTHPTPTSNIQHPTSNIQHPDATSREDAVSLPPVFGMLIELVRWLSLDLAMALPGVGCVITRFDEMLYAQV